jgi:hypothetical protein
MRDVVTNKQTNLQITVRSSVWRWLQLHEPKHVAGRYDWKYI